MSAQQKEEWTKKLVGKKIVEGAVTNDPKSFSKNDLPEPYRVVGPRTAVTLDYRPDRLNVNTDENDVVKGVEYN